jgi:arylsulfatase
MLRFILALLSCSLALHAAQRPNVLIILADDLGFSDLGCYGGEIRTPNLDALAANGLRFTQFYNSARCCPSRASLLTGLYPHQAGIGEMTNDRGAKFPGSGDNGENFPGYRGRLNDQCVTIAQVLKPAGYATAACGKWHVGDTISPIDRGFDDFYGFTSGYAVDSWDARMMKRLPVGASEPEHHKGGRFFATEAITDHAIHFIQSMRETKKPWFTYLAYQAPHFPIASQVDDMKDYPKLYEQGWDVIREERLKRMRSLGIVSEETPLTPRSKIPHEKQALLHGSMTKDGNNPAWSSLDAARQGDLAMRMAVYAGMVTGMDRNIGRVVEDLRKSGDLDNTLIVFLSDNGACAEWEPFGFDMVGLEFGGQAGVGVNMGTQALPNILHVGSGLQTMNKKPMSLGSGWANACNTPLRLYKHFAHEGGISTPFIAHWPAGIAAKGKLVLQPAHLVDLMATCVDLAGATYPAKNVLPMEGTSLAPILRGESLAARTLFFEHENNAAVRAGDWKLVRAGHDGAWELYKINEDRVEMHNVAADHADMVKDLAAQWDAWAARCHVTPRP